jgi:hypothetical protein
MVTLYVIVQYLSEVPFVCPTILVAMPSRSRQTHMAQSFGVPLSDGGHRRLFSVVVSPKQTPLTYPQNRLKQATLISFAPRLIACAVQSDVAASTPCYTTSTVFGCQPIPVVVLIPEARTYGWNNRPEATELCCMRRHRAHWSAAP